MLTRTIRFQTALFLVAIFVQPLPGQHQTAAPRPATAGAAVHARDGLRHYKSGRFREAAEAFKQAAQLKPDDPAVRYSLGMCYVRLGRYMESIAPFREALRLNPRLADGYPKLAAVYHYFGEYREAADLLKRAAGMGGGVEVYNNLGVTYYYLGQYKEAAEALIRAINLAPNLAAPRRNLSSVYQMLGRHKEAEEAQGWADRLTAAGGGQAGGRLLFLDGPPPTTVASQVPVVRQAAGGTLIIRDDVGGEVGGEKTNDDGEASLTPAKGGGGVSVREPGGKETVAKSIPTNPSPTPEAASGEGPAAAVQPVGERSAGTIAGAANAPNVPGTGANVVLPPVASPESLLSTTYRVGVGDVLDIRLLNSAVAGAKLYPVLAGGLLDYPLAGEPVQVAGLTTSEIEELLSSKIKLYDRPRVVVEVQDYNSHTVLVNGLVDAPGAKILRREAVPLYAVMADAHPKAEAGRVIITSRDGRRREVALDDDNSTGTLVYPGDVLTFQGRLQQFFYIGGGVKQPGQKSFRAGITLTQAILMAGGLTRTAGGLVEVSRAGEGGLLVTSRYDIRKINSGKTPDPAIQPGDRIVVKD